MPLHIKTPWARSRRYAWLGALLALGAPLGLFVVELLRARTLPAPGWVMSHFAAELAVYVYVTLSTTIVFAAFGWVVGRAGDRLDTASLTDALTGLGNRRQVDRRLAAELAHAARYRTPLAFLLIDVDRLKDINDFGGHQAGDLALKHIGEAIAATARRTDAAARIGGDEFALVAPATTAEEALALAERIRRRVLRDSSGTLSVSIGLADLSHAPSHDPEALVRAADRALYASKASGRDRVSAPPGPRSVAVPRGTSSRGGMSEAS